MNKRSIAALLAASAGAGLFWQPAWADQVIVVRSEPPPPRGEAVPDARRGYVWVPGYWNWNGYRYVWVRGKWLRERQGYHWRPSAWQQHDNGWHMQRGGWVRGAGDRDGDGIPNRADRDRDNDGVPNRYDAHPNNPERR